MTLPLPVHRPWLAVVIALAIVVPVAAQAPSSTFNVPAICSEQMYQALKSVGTPSTTSPQPTPTTSEAR